MFLDFSAVFPECRFSIPAPESHRSVAKLRRHKLRITRFRVGTKSSFAPLLLLSPKSHTTFWGPHCSSLSHIPFGRLFSFRLTPQLVVSEKGRKLTPSANFLNGVCNSKKSRYTAHQISGRKSLAISLMKLCTGSVIQKPSLSAFSAPLADSATGAAQPQSLSAAALCFISDIQLWTLL